MQRRQAIRGMYHKRKEVDIMGLKLDQRYKFTPEDVRQYEALHGTLAALEWLALVPQDKFAGDWQKTYNELEGKVYWGLENV